MKPRIGIASNDPNNSAITSNSTAAPHAPTRPSTSKRSQYKSRWFRRRESRRAEEVAKSYVETTAKNIGVSQGQVADNLDLGEGADGLGEGADGSECDLCSECMHRAEAVQLSCEHLLCATCAMQCVRSGMPEHLGQPVRFSTLFCPFRCGACFDSAVGMCTELMALVGEQMALMRRAEVSALSKLKAEGLLTQDLQRTCLDIRRFALNAYATFLCRACHGPFPMRQLCGADNEEGDHSGAWCSKCTKRGSANLRVSLYLPSKKTTSKESIHVVEVTKQVTREAVLREEDVLGQQMEVEALMATYPDVITVLCPPPSHTGESGALLSLRCPTDHQLDEYTRMRLASELSLHLELCATYPSTSKLRYTIHTGSLIIPEEFDHTTLASITEVLDTIILNKTAGEQCVFDVFLAFLDWIAEAHFTSQAALCIAQKHRLHIADEILTMRCPRCSTAILDFSGCMALSCECGCGFCGWCLEDCGIDAHAHVLICPVNEIGGYYASFNEFQQVHNLRRRNEIVKYIWHKVPVEEHRLVLDYMSNDLSDVGIQPITTTEKIYYRTFAENEAARKTHKPARR